MLDEFLFDPIWGHSNIPEFHKPIFFIENNKEKTMSDLTEMLHGIQNDLYNPSGISVLALAQFAIAHVSDFLALKDQVVSMVKEIENLKSQLPASNKPPLVGV